MLGGLSVTIPGAQLMPVLYVASLDTNLQVYIVHCWMKGCHLWLPTNIAVLLDY